MRQAAGDKVPQDVENDSGTSVRWRGEEKKTKECSENYKDWTENL